VDGQEQISPGKSIHKMRLCINASPSRLHSYPVALPDSHEPGILGVYFHKGRRNLPVQKRGSASHGPGMKVIEAPSGIEDKRIVGISNLRWFGVEDGAK